MCDDELITESANSVILRKLLVKRKSQQEGVGGREQFK
jgi:hypothetical protein